MKPGRIIGSKIAEHQSLRNGFGEAKITKDSKSDGQQIEEHLRASEERYRQIASNIPGVVYQLRVNKDGSFSFPFISGGVRKILGYTPEEVSQDPGLFLKSMMAGTPYSIGRMIQAMQQTSYTLSLELKTTIRNGETKWIRNVANPYPLHNGDIIWNGVIIDITEQILAQEALRQSEQRYREVFDHISDAIFIIDITPEGHFKFGSDNAIAREIIGPLPNSILGGLIEEYFPKELADTLTSNYRRCLQAGTTISYEESFNIKTGERYFYTTLAPLKDNTGQIFRIIGVAHDITQRKLAEKVLQDSERKYRSLVNNIKLGVFRSTAQGIHLEVNQAMEEITGYCREELLTMNVTDLYSYPEERQAILAQLISTPGKKTKEIKNKRKDGTPIIVAATITPIVDSSGNVLYFDGILEDVTERKNLEEQLKELYEKEKKETEELQTEAKARGLFIDVLAHELKTPVTPMLASSELLQELLQAQPDSIQKKLAANIYDSTQTLARRLEELLEMARYTRGAFKLQLQPVDIRKFIKEVASRFKPGLELKKQQLIIDLPEGLPMVEVDPSRLEQVILNLLSNASKFSPDQGIIQLKASLVERELQVDVKDNGIGIPKEQQGRLFQPYHRVEQGQRRLPGLGLGLAISKQIVEAHGGRIWLYSQPGKGSTFSFQIPLRGCDNNA